MEEFNHKHFNYTWTKGFGVAIFLVLILLAGSAYAQIISGSVNTPSGYSIDATTGNLIPYDSSLKTNTGVTSSLGGFAGSFDPTDGYTFSYVNETIGWAGINLGGFNPGYQNTGAVFVTGFMYGLKYRFPCANQIGGSCTDTNGLQDTLRVEIGYYPYSGSPDFRIHQLGLKNQTDGNSPYNPNWQQLAETYTFSGAKTLAQAGAVNMSIIGQDAGFWACLMPDCYGPQVKDVYLRANYSVDPCILNPAFNPSCPGFQNILQGPKSPTFYYSYNIAQSLPHIGGGVQLHGYDYGFSWYNYGACYNTFMFWCTDWRTDGGGNINFRISDKNNNTMFSNQWYVAGNNSGGGFSSRYLFTESQNSLNMGSVQWWTDSVWNHFGWTGWTRPIWSPDPCYDQPLFSPNCSNFDAEIKRLADEQNTIQKKSLDSTIASISSTSTTPEGTVTVKIDDASTTKPSVTVTTETDAAKPAPQHHNPKPEPIVSSDTLGSSSPNTRTGMLRTEQSNSTELALSLARQNQLKETNISTQASQNAIQTASIAATSSVRQAESTATDAVVRSQNAIQTQETRLQNETSPSSAKTDQSRDLMGPAPGSSSVVNSAIQQKHTPNVNVVDIPIQQTASINSTTAVVLLNAMNIVVEQNNIQVSNINASQSSIQSTNTFTPVISPVIPQQQVQTPTPLYVTPIQQSNIEVRVPESLPPSEVTYNSSSAVNVLQVPSTTVIEIIQQVIQTTLAVPIVAVDVPVSQTSFTTDKTNPITNIVENKQPSLEQDKKDTSSQQVKSNVQDNDAAAGVSIANIARTPVGFNSYMVALSDANFYTPKEIYRNQRTVDNVRVLRQLASDRLHQQMVDQQYLPR